MSVQLYQARKACSLYPFDNTSTPQPHTHTRHPTTVHTQLTPLVCLRHMPIMYEAVDTGDMPIPPPVHPFTLDLAATGPLAS